MNVDGNGHTIADVAVDVTVECTDERGIRHEIDVVLGYRRCDPYAVTMTFLTADGDLTWTFARDLLSYGLGMPTGDGDVRVAPAVSEQGAALVSIDLSSPDGHLGMRARARAVHDFVARTASVVPEGAEADHLDLDTVIDQVLSASA